MMSVLDNYNDYPRVTIIILNYNGHKYTIDCIKSLYNVKYVCFNLIILDNNSEEKSFKKLLIHLREKFILREINNNYNNNEIDRIFKVDTNLIYEKKIVLIRTKENYGFSKGNNIGIKFAIKNLKTDYVLLLNNDTIVHPDFLKDLIEPCLTNKEIGIIGPNIYFCEDPQVIQSAGAFIKWYSGSQKIRNFRKKEIVPKIELTEVDYVSGCSMLIKRELFEEIGYLKEEYFAYWEETDFCVRAKRKGYKVIHNPKSKVWHKVSSTTKKINGFYAYYMTRNMFWFMKEHATKTQIITFIFYFFTITIWLKILEYYIYDGKTRALKNLFKGIIDGIK